MTDPNRDLIGKVARRGEPPEPVVTPTPVASDWNVPIDVTQADCMSALMVIRGMVADAKRAVAQWTPRPCP